MAENNDLVKALTSAISQLAESTQQKARESQIRDSLNKLPIIGKEVTFAQWLRLFESITKKQYKLSDEETINLLKDYASGDEGVIVTHLISDLQRSFERNPEERSGSWLKFRQKLLAHLGEQDSSRVNGKCLTQAQVPRHDFRKYATCKWRLLQDKFPNQENSFCNTGIKLISEHSDHLHIIQCVGNSGH